MLSVEARTLRPLIVARPISGSGKVGFRPDIVNADFERRENRRILFSSTKFRATGRELLIQFGGPIDHEPLA